MQVEQSKVALSSDARVSMMLDRLTPQLEVGISKQTFQASIAHLSGAIAGTVATTLVDAGIEATAIDTLFFTGGSSGVAGLREQIGVLVPNARCVVGDLFGSIGLGLAVQADRHFR